jgi:DNA-binding transcriptional regulator YiaG
MKTTRITRKSRQAGRAARRELLAPGIPYTMKLSDGRTVFVEVPARMATRDRSGELAFMPEGVHFLDRVRALALQPGHRPSPAYLATLRESLGLTQAQVGRLVGRNKLTVSRWECGAISPSAEALHRLYALARKKKEAGVVLAG